MRVERFYTRSVIGIPRASTIEKAAEMMRKYHVGALVVMGEPPDENKIVGFLTDRDIVMQAVAEGYAPEEITVGEVMTPEVASIAEDSDLHAALETMRVAGVRRLLVTKPEGGIAGILSVDDVVDALAADLSSLAGLMKSERVRESEEYGGLRLAA